MYTPHTLLEFGGRLAEGGSYGEIWSCGIRCFDHNLQAPVPDADIEDWIDWYAPKLSDWYTAAPNKMSTNAELSYIKINNIGADGKYANAGNTHVYDYPAGRVGAAPATAPNFLSVAWTWETGRQRGRAHRGRMYPPNPTWAFTGAILSAADALANANVGQRLWHDVLYTGRSAGFEDYLEPQVFSKLDASHHPITGVSCDNVYDVQRRRKNQAPKTRTAVVPLDIT